METIKNFNRAVIAGCLALFALIGLSIALAPSAQAQLDGCEDASLGGLCGQQEPDIITVIGTRINSDNTATGIQLRFLYSDQFDPGYVARTSLCVDYADVPNQPDEWAVPCITGPSNSQTRNNVNHCDAAGQVESSNDIKNMYRCDDGIYVAVREGWNPLYERWRNLNNPLN